MPQNKNISTPIATAILAIAAVVGGFVSRWHGGGFFSAPKWVKNLAWGLPFGFVSGYAAAGETAHWYVPYAVGAVVTAICFGMIAAGHGRGISLKKPMKPTSTPEWQEWPVLWLINILPTYWYKMLILLITGITATIAAAVSIGIFYPWAGVVVFIGGALKSFAYGIGWWIFPEGGISDGLDDFDEATEIGETLNGIFAFSALAIAALMVFVS